MRPDSDQMRLDSDQLRPDSDQMLPDSDQLRPDSRKPNHATQDDDINNCREHFKL